MSSPVETFRPAAVALLLFALSPVAQATAQSGGGGRFEAEALDSVENCVASEKQNPRACIGRLSAACRDKLPGGGMTISLAACDAQERAAWEEIARREIAGLSAGALGRTKAEPWNRPAAAPRTSAVAGAEIIADMHRAWMSFAPRKCDTESLQAEGGSYSRIVYGLCMMRAAGEHALWLRALREEVDSH